VIAHVGGVPVEELLPAFGAGGSLLAGRAWIWLQAVRARHRDGGARAPR
jgi:hypothetical protein